MSLTEIWVLIGAVLLASLVTVGLVATTRRTAALRGRDRARELPPGAGSASEVEETRRGGSVRLDERPATEELSPDVLDAEPGALVIERPDSRSSRLARLRRRLAGSSSALSRGMLMLLSRDRIDEDTWEDFEDTLITSDLGVGPTTELVSALRSRLRVDGVADPGQARAVLREELIRLVDPTLDRTVHAERSYTPGVVMVVGVNGTGKTTTAGKLARVLVAEDKDVLLGAADTFRAAAADQLETWGARVGVPTVRGAEGADPASVAFEAVSAGIEGEVDTVIIDTAGRLHTKTGLMDELGKVKRVLERKAPVTEVLLVLDATTGQNGLTQARIFAEVVQVQRELGVPVKLVGMGEGVDDLAPFDTEVFVDALLDQG